MVPDISWNSWATGRQHILFKLHLNRCLNLNRFPPCLVFAWGSFPGPREGSSHMCPEQSPALVDIRSWGVHLGSLWGKWGWVVQRAHQLTALSPAGLPWASLHCSCRSARCPETEPGARSRGVGPTEDVPSHELWFRRAGSHLPWDSKAFCLKMAFAVAMLCRQRGLEEATSTLPLGITSHICFKTHKFMQLFSHTLFRSLEVKMWASPQPPPCQEKSSHATFQHTDYHPPVLITHAYTLLQNTWGSRPQLFGNPKKLHSYTKDSHFLFTSKPWMKE